MSKARKILAEALDLDDEERAMLALGLMDSLSSPDSRDEASRIEEIERRARCALEGGGAPGGDLEVAIDRIALDLGL